MTSPNLDSVNKMDDKQHSRRPSESKVEEEIKHQQEQSALGQLSSP
jgi:hypothetical protein